MSTLLTPTQLRQHIETGIGDEAIQRVLDGVDGEIIRRLGALTSETEVLAGGDKFLHLTRQASSIDSIVERVLQENTSLVSGDYSLLSDGFRVERLTDGLNGFNRWQGMVTISYTPISESSERILAEIDLCRIELRLQGVKFLQIGPCETDELDNPELARNRIFMRLNTMNRRLIT